MFWFLSYHNVWKRPKFLMTSRTAGAPSFPGPLARLSSDNFHAWRKKVFFSDRNIRNGIFGMWGEASGIGNIRMIPGPVIRMWESGPVRAYSSLIRTWFLMYFCKDNQALRPLNLFLDKLFFTGTNRGMCSFLKQTCNDN